MFGGNDYINQKFTGKERDLETGLDFFSARYFGAAQGRFTSPDPANVGAALTNPQSWNAYSYTWNNPVSFVDPTGTETAIYQFSNCYYYTYDWSYTDSNGVYTVTNSTERFGDCSGTGRQTVPPKTGNANANLPTPTIFKLTIPGTNYCGPGGNGVPTDRVDAACAKHDRCYENAGVSFVNNVGWPKTAQQRAAIKACDANLSNDLMHIYFPTSAEAGQATIVSTHFNLPSGYNLRP